MFFCSQPSNRLEKTDMISGWYCLHHLQLLAEYLELQPFPNANEVYVRTCMGILKFRNTLRLWRKQASGITVQSPVPRLIHQNKQIMKLHGINQNMHLGFCISNHEQMNFQHCPICKAKSLWCKVFLVQFRLILVTLFMSHYSTFIQK